MVDRPKSYLGLSISIFAVATFFYLYEFLLRVAPSVLYAELTSAFAIDATLFGVLSSCYYWAYAPLQLPIGALTDKYGTRRLLTMAIFMCALSTLLFAKTHSFYLACLARFFIGAGSAFAFISCMKIISVWFKPSLFPLLSGLTLTIGTLGAAANAPLSFALNYIQWRELLWGIGWVGIGLGVLAWWVIRDENPHENFRDRDPLNSDSTQQVGFWRCVKEISRRPQSWLVGFYAFLVTAPTDAFGGSWGIPYLLHVHQIPRDLAASAVSMTFVGMAVGSTFLGWVSGALNARKVPMVCAAIGAVMALSAIIYLPHLSALSASLLFFLFGMCGTYVLAFVVIRDLTEARFVGTAVGFVNMMSMIGSAILTWVIGYLLDHFRLGGPTPGDPIYSANDYHLSLGLLPLFYAVSALIVIPLIPKHKPQVAKAKMNV